MTGWFSCSAPSSFRWLILSLGLGFPTFSKYLSPDRLEPSGVTFKCLNSLPRTQSGLGTHVRPNMHLYEGGCVWQAGYCSFMCSDWKERVNIWLKGGGEIYYVIKNFSMEVYYCPPQKTAHATRLGVRNVIKKQKQTVIVMNL